MPFAVLAVLMLAGFYSAPAVAGPNRQMCLMLQTNFNQCVQRQMRRQEHYREEYEEWGGPPPWADHHHHAHEDCNAWLAQIYAAGCN